MTPQEKLKEIEGVPRGAYCGVCEDDLNFLIARAKQLEKALEFYVDDIDMTYAQKALETMP